MRAVPFVASLLLGLVAVAGDAPAPAVGDGIPGLLEGLGATAVECSPDERADPARLEVAVCATSDVGVGPFRKRWRRALEGAARPIRDAEPLTDWYVDGALAERAYRIDVAPLTVRYDADRGRVRIVLSSLVDCDAESWRRLAGDIAPCEGDACPTLLRPGGWGRSVSARPQDLEGRVSVLALVRPDGTVEAVCVESAEPRSYERVHPFAVMQRNNVWTLPPGDDRRKAIVVRAEYATPGR